MSTETQQQMTHTGSLDGLKFTQQNDNPTLTAEQIAAQQAADAKKASDEAAAAAAAAAASKTNQQQQQQQQQQQATTKTDEELQTQIATDYPGATFDKDLNLVDKTGKVVATAEDLLTKYPELAGNGTQEDYALTEQLEQLYGVSLVDEQGNRRSVENTAEGVLTVIKDLIPTTRQQAVQTFLNSTPGLLDVARHLSTGGKIEDYKPKVDYSTIEIDAKNKDQHVAILADSYQRKGIEANEALELAKARIAGSTDSNALASAAKDEIVANDKKAKDAAIAAEKVRVQDERNKLIAHYNERFELINKSVIKTDNFQFEIPKAEHQEFRDYISKPVQGEYTKADLDLAKLSTEQEVLLQYMLYKKMDVASLAKEMSASAHVTRLREIAQKNQSTKSVQQQQRQTNSLDLSSLNLKGMNVTSV